MKTISFFLCLLFQAIDSQKVCHIHTSTTTAIVQQSLICSVAQCATFYFECTKDGSDCITVHCESNSCYNASLHQCQEKFCPDQILKPVEKHPLCMDLKASDTFGFALNGPSSSDYAVCDRQHNLWLLSCNEKETYDPNSNRCIEKKTKTSVTLLHDFCEKSGNIGKYPIGKCQKFVLNCKSHRIEKCRDDLLANQQGNCVESSTIDCANHPRSDELELKVVAESAGFCGRHAPLKASIFHAKNDRLQGFILCVLNKANEPVHIIRLCGEGEEIIIGTSIYCVTGDKNHETSSLQVADLILKDICNQKGPELRRFGGTDDRQYIDCRYKSEQQKPIQMSCDEGFKFVEAIQSCYSDNKQNCFLDGKSNSVLENKVTDCKPAYKVCIRGVPYWLQCPGGKVHCGIRGCVEKTDCAACDADHTHQWPHEPNNTPPPVTKKCSKEGQFKAHPSDCAKYMVCEHSKWRAMPCAEGTHYDANIGVCNHIGQVKCDHYQYDLNKDKEDEIDA